MLLYCIVLYCIVLYCIVLYCIVLYCIVLYCIVLYCIAVLRYTVSMNYELTSVCVPRRVVSLALERATERPGDHVLEVAVFPMDSLGRR